ncbi:MAG TPA: TorF family putative porin [Gammaproteobacteria bacterium]
MTSLSSSRSATRLAGVFVATTIVASGVSAQDRAPGLTAYVTVANDYRQRGLSQLDSGVSWQIGVDYEHMSGFFIGGFAANVGYAVEETWPEQRDYVVDYYAGYGWGRRDWRFNVALGRYAYPDVSFDYDYNELTFSTTFKKRFSYTAGYTDRLYDRPYSAWYHELGFAQPLRFDLELSAALGQFSADIPGYEVDYTHWNVGLSKVIRHVALDLRFFAATEDAASILGDPASDAWVFSVSYGFRFAN